MADEIPPLPLRRGRTGPEGVVFPVPLAVRLKARGQDALIALRFTGARPGLQLKVEDASGGALFSAPLTEAEPLILVPLPRGAARIVVAGAGAELRAGFLPVPDSYPLGRLVLKLNAFLRGRIEMPPGAKGGLAGLSQRWKIATDAARELRARLSTLIVSSPFGRFAQQADYQRFRARWVEDFAEVAPAEAAPRLVFISAGPACDATGLRTCAAALKAQGDPAFEWLVALPAGAPQLPAEVDELARRVPAPGPGEADGLAAALAATAPGTLVSVLDPAGTPTRDAVAMIRAAFAAHPDCQLLYTDEERLDAAGAPLEGVFKPAFNRHLLEAWPYMGAFTVLRADKARALGLDPAHGGGAIYDLVLRYVEGLDSAHIRHLPRVAYVGPEGEAGFADATAAAEGARALKARLGTEVEVSADGRFLRPLFPVPAVAPKVSIVIPTRDRAAVLGMTLRTLVANTAYRNFEIIVVDNGSVEPETFALFEETKAAWPATTIVRDDGDFNFPRICNAGVAAMTGELILLLNNDIEVIEGGWLDEMVGLICRRDGAADTGVVGAKLLFPDRSIQHAGVIAGLFRYAAHWFAHCPHWARGYEGRLLTRQNLSSVTGACLLIRKDVWDAIGPLDEVRFAEDCNDIDLCLRARRGGYGVVETPHALLIHHESASRGRRRTAEHRARLKAQRARFDAIWHATTLVDPHYSPNLKRDSLLAACAAAPEGPREARTDAI
ncbi:glycosyltransferase family 2 protein [Xanthobacter sediminis]|uniref:glycosyltransferase family 2 protein n=1 Tax=Xanthobacter sediminis TaxID=3119926 RepID=UPI00372735F1